MIQVSIVIDGLRNDTEVEVTSQSPYGPPDSLGLKFVVDNAVKQAEAALEAQN